MEEAFKQAVKESAGPCLRIQNYGKLLDHISSCSQCVMWKPDTWCVEGKELERIRKNSSCNCEK